MATCPWDHGLDVSVVGDGLYLNGTRIPMPEAPEFLSWLQQVVTGEVTW
jgi:hypothetical protein